MNTVAYVGNFEPKWSTENDVRLAFEHLGWDVIKLQEDKVSAAAVHDMALQSDLLLWTGTWDDVPATQLHSALDTFHDLANRNIPSATLHLDTFWATARGGRRWWQHPMFHTGLVCTADGTMQHHMKFEKMGVRHRWLRPGVRHSVAQQGAGTFRPEYACDVALVGASGCSDYHPEWTYRCELTEALKRMCERNGWTFKNPGGIRTEPNDGKVTRDNMADFYASAKVTVGDSLCPYREESLYWSDRVPESTGRAGLLIMPEIDELNSQREFDTNLPVYPWGQWAVLEQLIAGYLSDEKMNQETRQVCWEITRESGTYVNRVQELLEAL